MKLNRADSIKAMELAKKYNISIDEMKKILGSPYLFIHKKSKELIIKHDLSREEFDKLKSNYNIPSLGKIYASYFLYSQINFKKKK